MREFDRIKDMVYNELEEIAGHGQLTKEAVCIIGELVDILKDIGTVEMFEEGFDVPENEYSLASGYSRTGGYSQRRGYRGSNYTNNNSYRNGGRMYNYGYSRYGGYSREDGKEYMMQKLEELMNEAVNEQDRQSIQNLIHQMNNN